MSEKAKLILLVLLSGIIYSIFINPISTEHVEFAQTLAGQIKISQLNPFYFSRQLDVTLQAVLPAVLLKFGVPALTLALISSVISQLVPFLALSLLVFFLTQNLAVSYFSILIFLGTSSGMNHFYALSFPADFFVFGNLATWLTVLSVAFYLNGFKKIGSFLIALMMSIHLAWFGAALIYFLYFLYKSTNRKSLLLYFSLGVFCFGAMIFVNQYFYKNYFVQSVYPEAHRQSLLTPVVDVQASESRHVVKRTPMMGHTPQLFLGSTKENLKQFWKMISFSVLVLALYVSLKVRQDTVVRERLDLLVVPYLWLFSLVIGSLFAIELNEYFDISPQFADLALRLIPNRYFNLSYVICQALIVGELFYLAKNRRESRIFQFLLAVFAVFFARDPYRGAVAVTLFLLLSDLFAKLALNLERFLSQKFRARPT